ncbi:uncharacterized protein FFB20_04681 [Fusarium fujikuroi]|uniref:Uncharacterized protein n=2 Tax=Fusarium fujikuroi TaxID=5127 RepID=S0E1S6_GIBF5|nr:uncharacterized protein FFUJ_14559 [Fusarium fujikuroi IMI 58289]KLO82709.1 uncharacterized protein LW93_9913 [Fusarium fujikuroi]KLP17092.1 uncharacterized protein LW94_974 [Fusarium fujikuroi]QGI63607.1 hypothetical protein CEK27_007578 [Fusarium fujikuroi]QGI80878.1 hypothetical protein CEK25_007607 [Fusarium fujikuroi]QGI94489.1 hypothetical protein CEK26_007558 [Fusarium fujikuroi]
MALEQTITIVNNSGKIIKTGKQLFSIFKEAQGNYKDKKAEIKAQQGVQRSQSFDVNAQPQAFPVEHFQIDDDRSRYYPPRAGDQRSEAGSQRSRRSRSVHSRHPREDFASRRALTLDNLERHTEISATAPSKAPTRTVYKEIPMELAMPQRSMAPSAYGAGPMVPRNRSTGELVQMRPRKEIDMDLAYGSVPPDLKDRTDLDPQYYDEKQAMGLVHRVEGLLTEAKCIHHSATTTMAELQKNPDHAAAVALSLAELSKMVKKTSPAFLGLLKSGSPAVFSLLSSPQFLIGTSIAAGVTVICFGGWKIFQRMKEEKAAREALAYEGVPMDRPAPLRTQSEYGVEYGPGVDEALILDDDLSSIETWRRGIVPYGEDESEVDMELITPLADRETRSRYGGDDFDTKSRRSTRTSKTHESSRSHKTHRTDDSRRSHRSHRSRRDDDDRSTRREDYAESIADSERSHRSSRSKRSERIETRSIDSRSSSRRDDESQVTVRPKVNRNNSNMLKALFKNKEKKERSLVMA